MIIKKEKNTSVLCENGKTLPPIMYALSDFPAAGANTHYAYTNIQGFAQAGVNIVCANSELNLGWHKQGAYDSEAVISEIESVMDANPDARVFLRLHLAPPYWWLRDHPEECAVFRTEDGDVRGADNGEQDRLIRGDDGLSLRVSLASEKWKKEAGQRLKALLEDIKGTRAGRGLAAIHIASGMFGEWHAWGRCFADVSAPMKRSFKKFLEAKYECEERLRAAWHDSEVSFDSAEYKPEPFAPFDIGYFRDPTKSARVIDSQRANQKAVTDAILHFASIVKETSPELLCGTFYAYYLCTEDTGVIGAHLNVTEIQKSELIDFLCGPFCYMENRKPYGIPMQRTFLESNRLNGKLWLTEMDSFPLGVEKRSDGTAENFTTNVAMLRRDTLQPIFGGGGFWFYDHRLAPQIKVVREMGDVRSDIASIYRKRGWWQSPEMMSEISRIYSFAGEFIKRDFTSDADVLIIYDAEAKYYKYTPNPNDTEYALFDSVARCGVGYDCIYLSDLAACNTDKYKCIIFADCPNITPAMRATIKEKTSGKTRVFLHGCGFSDGEALSASALSLTVGINVEEKNGDLYINDKSAEAVSYSDDGRVSAARSENSFYVSAPYLDRETAKKIIAFSGAHAWCNSEEPVIASSGYVLTVCQHAGERKIFFRDGESITLHTESEYETAVIDTETKKRVL